MFKGFFAGVAVAAAAMFGIKKLSEYAETRDDLRDIKDKLAKTRDDVAADCKDVAQSVAAAVRGSGAGAEEPGTEEPGAESEKTGADESDA
ncbi:MAG: hypothetical protein K6G18_16770 [Treponema sp.]|jgi:hypothetical protein|nr:hypothetical protein [Treponema sp.]